MQTVISLSGTPLASGKRLEIIGRRRIEIDQAFGKAGADGDLVHIDGGHFQQAAALGQRKHGERVGQRLGAERRAFDRIDGEIDLERGVAAGADGFADIEERGLVLLALADHHHPFDRQAGKLPIHGGGGGLVGGSLVAAAPPQRGGHGRGLGHANDIERQSAVELGLRLSLRHVRSSLPSGDLSRRL